MLVYLTSISLIAVTTAQNTETCHQKPDSTQLFTCESIEKLYFFNATSLRCQRFWGCDRQFFGSLAECFVECEDRVIESTTVRPVQAPIFYPRQVEIQVDPSPFHNEVQSEPQPVDRMFEVTEDPSGIGNMERFALEDLTYDQLNNRPNQPEEIQWRDQAAQLLSGTADESQLLDDYAQFPDITAYEKAREMKEFLRNNKSEAEFYQPENSNAIITEIFDDEEASKRAEKSGTLQSTTVSWISVEDFESDGSNSEKVTTATVPNLGTEKLGVTVAGDPDDQWDSKVHHSFTVIPSETTVSSAGGQWNPKSPSSTVIHSSATVSNPKTSFQDHMNVFNELLNELKSLKRSNSLNSNALQELAKIEEHARKFEKINDPMQKPTTILSKSTVTSDPVKFWAKTFPSNPSNLINPTEHSLIFDNFENSISNEPDFSLKAFDGSETSTAHQKPFVNRIIIQNFTGYGKTQHLAEWEEEKVEPWQYFYRKENDRNLAKVFKNRESQKNQEFNVLNDFNMKKEISNFPQENLIVHREKNDLKSESYPLEPSTTQQTARILKPNTFKTTPIPIFTPNTVLESNRQRLSDPSDEKTENFGRTIGFRSLKFDERNKESTIDPLTDHFISKNFETTKSHENIKELIEKVSSKHFWKDLKPITEFPLIQGTEKTTEFSKLNSEKDETTQFPSIQLFPSAFTTTKPLLAALNFETTEFPSINLFSTNPFPKNFGNTDAPALLISPKQNPALPEAENFETLKSPSFHLFTSTTKPSRNKFFENSFETTPKIQYLWPLFTPKLEIPTSTRPSVVPIENRQTNSYERQFVENITKRIMNLFGVNSMKNLNNVFPMGSALEENRELQASTESLGNFLTPTMKSFSEKQQNQQDNQQIFFDSTPFFDESNGKMVNEWSLREPDRELSQGEIDSEKMIPDNIERMLKIGPVSETNGCPATINLQISRCSERILGDVMKPLMPLDMSNVFGEKQPQHDEFCRKGNAYLQCSEMAATGHPDCLRSLSVDHLHPTVKAISNFTCSGTGTLLWASNRECILQVTQSQFVNSCIISKTEQASPNLNPLCPLLSQLTDCVQKAAIVLCTPPQNAQLHTLINDISQIVDCSGERTKAFLVPNTVACQTLREVILGEFRQNLDVSLLNYLPNCKTDGAYQPMQCSQKGSCWCVDELGIPLRETFSTPNHPLPQCGDISVYSCQRVADVTFCEVSGGEPEQNVRWYFNEGECRPYMLRQCRENRHSPPFALSFDECQMLCLYQEKKKIL